MTLRLPDFVIAGAPRCGTTWLTSALDRHPDIWLAKPRRPEPKFFLVDELYELGIEEYSRRWFAGAPGGAKVGEKSTNYLESPVAAERMAAHLPGVRLLFVYSLGLGLPFILAAMAIGPFVAFLQRFRKHLGRVEMVMGLLLVAAGVLMLTGSLNWFGQWLIENVPVLARIEESFTPKELQTEILKEGAR
jgi:hypothetical protein